MLLAAVGRVANGASQWLVCCESSRACNSSGASDSISRSKLSSSAISCSCVTISKMRAAEGRHSLRFENDTQRQIDLECPAELGHELERDQ